MARYVNKDKSAFHDVVPKFASRMMPLLSIGGFSSHVSRRLIHAWRGYDWLVGDRMTYADLAFVPWQRQAPKYCGDELYVTLPAVKAWMDRLEARPVVKSVFDEQARALRKETN